MLKAVKHINYFIIFYFVLICLVNVLLMFFARIGVLRQKRHTTMIDYLGLAKSPYTLPISIIVPAINEEKYIVDSVKALLNLDYPEYEVLVISDGSTDKTVEKLIDSFSMEPIDRIVWQPKTDDGKRISYAPVKAFYYAEIKEKRRQLILADKLHGGKADALNAGLLLSKYPLVCSIDADTILESDALLKVVKPFMDDPDRVVASGGIVRIANNCGIKDGKVYDVAMSNNSWVAFQIVEYMRAFFGARYTLGQLNALLIIAGAFTVLRKDIAIKIGGFNVKSIVEDMEIIMDIRRYLSEQKKRYKVTFIAAPIAWTEVPSTFKSLMQQRIRWHRGLAEVFLSNRKLLFNPKYGYLGMFVLPYYFLLELIAPVIETLGYFVIPISAYFNLISWKLFWLFFAVSLAYGFFLTLLALLLHELSERQYYHFTDILKFIFYGFVENIFYRPVTSVVRTYAIVSMWVKIKWVKPERKGFDLNSSKTVKSTNV